MAKMTERQFKIGDMFLEAIHGDRLAQNHLLQEAITTSDVPTALQPTMEIMMRESYNEVTSNWTEYAGRESTPDFDGHPSFTFEWADSNIPGKKDGKQFSTGGLSAVAEMGEYPAINFTASEQEIKTRKNGVKIGLSWETILRTGRFDLIKRAMQEFGRRAKQEENYEAARQLVNATGLNTANFRAGNGNTLEGNPALSLAALESAFATLATTKRNGRRIATPAQYNLLVPSTLKPLADQLVSIPSFEREDANGKYTIGNPVAGKIAKVIEVPEFSVISDGAADTAWFLLPTVGSSAQPNVVNVFLDGEEAPKIFVKGDTNADPKEGNFDHDAYETKIRHVVAGGFIDPTATLGSTGAGK